MVLFYLDFNRRQRQTSDKFLRFNSVSPCLTVLDMQVLILEIGCLANNFEKHDYFIELFFLGINKNCKNNLQSYNDEIIKTIIAPLRMQNSEAILNYCLYLTIVKLIAYFIT